MRHAPYAVGVLQVAGLLGTAGQIEDFHLAPSERLSRSISPYP